MRMFLTRVLSLSRMFGSGARGGIERVAVDEEADFSTLNQGWLQGSLGMGWGEMSLLTAAGNEVNEGGDTNGAESILTPSTVVAMVAPWRAAPSGVLILAFAALMLVRLA